MIDNSTLERLRQIASVYSRVQDEVDDLVQDVLLEAIEKRRDTGSAHFMSWARGVIRNRAAFLARSAGRRRKREQAFSIPHDPASPERMTFPESFIQKLRPSTKILARLLNAGLARSEILFLLEIPDTAFRQRLTFLRKSWARYAADTHSGPESLGDVDSPVSVGLTRRVLRDCLRRDGRRAFGTMDPDGHPIIIFEVPAHKQEKDGNIE